MLNFELSSNKVKGDMDSVGFSRWHTIYYDKTQGEKATKTKICRMIETNEMHISKWFSMLQLLYV